VQVDPVSWGEVAAGQRKGPNRGPKQPE
jgi:hypothetical protein